MRESPLKSIRQLLDLDFFIPSYQRGYRWDETQVQDLLEDIWDFHRIGSKKEGEFYCLQPIIVKKEGERYKLIDGQQRLTTVYILLSYFEFYMERYKYRKFDIEYETRGNSKGFLNKIFNITEVNKTNIDYYHISKAFLTIKEWFEKFPEREINFFNILTVVDLSDKKDISNNVRVIWYEIGEDEKEIEVFTRINSGKIPLTNAELIKALFLNSKNFSENEKDIRQIEISKEWDEMEHTLQNDEFWYFLTRDKNYSTRIELIFEIFANIETNDRYDTYRWFAQQDNIVNIWSTDNESIKKVFLSLKYWFEHRKLYHLIGFLISEEIETAKSIYQKFKSKTKSQFNDEIHQQIVDILNLKKLNDLEYEKEKDRKDIKRILLLFNIATILNNKDSYIRFSFDKFNNEKWSLEHIHAQNEKTISNIDEQKKWLKEAKKYVDYCMEKNTSKQRQKLILQIDKALNKDKIENFEDIQNNIFNLFGNNEIHTIDNLALLPKNSNSSLSNNIFPIKRDIIIDKDKQGEFIPICTKNVFLKFYSNSISKLYVWQEEDRQQYITEIKRVLNEFIGVKND